MRNAAWWLVLVIVIALGAVLYVTDVLPERVAGAALAFALVGLPAPYAGLRLAQVVTNRRARGAVIGVGLLAAALGVVSIYGALFPGEARYIGRLSEEQIRIEIGSVASGAYLLVVEGALPEREGEVNIEYKLRLATAGKNEEIKGELWRRSDQVRVGKRGAAMQEHHRTSGEYTVFLNEGQGEIEQLAVSSSLPGGLSFQLFEILMPMSAFVVACGLLFFVGAFLEGRYGNDRLRGLLASALAFTLAVGYMYPDQMSAEAYVRPAIGVGVTSIFFAILLGGGVGSILRRLLRKADQAAL